MATSAVLFSGMNFFARLASHSAPWAVVGCARAAIGAVVAFSVARAQGRSIAVRSHKALLWRSSFGTVAMLSTFSALGRPALPLGDTTTLLNLSPVFIALLAPLVLGEPTSRRVWVALPLSLGGVVLLLRPAAIFGGIAHTPAAASAALWAVAASGSAAFAMMALRKVGKSETPEAIAFHFSVVATIVLLAIASFDFRTPDPIDALYTLLAGFAAGFAQLGMTRAYALESAAVTSSVGYIAVPTSALLSALWLHERPSALAFLGMALVVAGGLTLTPFVRKPSLSRTLRSRKKAP